MGWSVGRQVDRPCGWQISPWPARKVTDFCASPDLLSCSKVSLFYHKSCTTPEGNPLKLRLIIKVTCPRGRDGVSSKCRFVAPCCRWPLLYDCGLSACLRRPKPSNCPKWFCLKFPNAVVLNAVGRRKTQLSARERKCKSAKGRKRSQKSASASQMSRNHAKK